MDLKFNLQIYFAKIEYGIRKINSSIFNPLKSLLSGSREEALIKFDRLMRKFSQDLHIQVRRIRNQGLEIITQSYYEQLMLCTSREQALNKYISKVSAASSQSKFYSFVSIFHLF